MTSTLTRPIDTHSGQRTGRLLRSYRDYRDAPVGTVAVAITGHWPGTAHLKTREAFWTTFHWDWAGIPDRIGEHGSGGVSPDPGSRGVHEIVAAPDTVVLPPPASVDEDLAESLLEEIAYSRHRATVRDFPVDTYAHLDDQPGPWRIWSHLRDESVLLRRWSRHGTRERIIPAGELYRLTPCHHNDDEEC